MQNQFVITIDNNIQPSYALDFFRKINFVKSIRQKKLNKKEIEEDSTCETMLLSEKSLAEDWLSDEDNRWDEVL